MVRTIKETQTMNVTGKIMRYAALLIAVIILTGCVTVGPDYVKPDVKAPEKWKNLPVGGDHRGGRFKGFSRVLVGEP
jgi:predicted small lipoprotein YifL